MKQFFVCLFALVLGSAKAATQFAVSEVYTTTITSIEQADTLVRLTQSQFWQLVPPSGDGSRYIHSDQQVRPVIWSKGWPNALKKQIYAEMQLVNGQQYPVYTLWVVEDRYTGELVYFNVKGDGVYRSPAPKGYNPYVYIMDLVGVDSEYELSDSQLQMSAANVGLEIQLIPEEFLVSYESDLAAETKTQTVMTSESMMMSAPMMMAMSLPEVVTNLQMGIESLSNGTVEVQIGWPAGFSDALEIYSATDLIAGNWQFAHTNILTSGSSEFYWTDTQTNNSSCYYVAGNADIDEDGDGLANAREKYLYKTNPLLIDSDGDSLLDGAELTNDPPSDPSLYDSNGDGLHDGLAFQLSQNSSDGVLINIPDAGFYFVTEPNSAFNYLGQ